MSGTEVVGYNYYVCEICDYDCILLRPNTRPYCPLCAVDSGRGNLMLSRPATTEDRCEGPDERPKKDEISTLVERYFRGEHKFISELNRAKFQARVFPWMIACFGERITFDGAERNHRFLEEALELVQSLGTTKEDAHQLVDYVFGRVVGDPNQEAGGVMVTLAALGIAHGIEIQDAGEVELARIWTKIEKIRAKQAAKPKHSPLPE